MVKAKSVHPDRSRVFGADRHSMKLAYPVNAHDRYM